MNPQGQRPLFQEFQFLQLPLVIDSEYVKENLGQLVKDNDLSKFIL